MHKLDIVGLALLLVASCSGPLGKKCKTDSDCGPGYDCFPDVCVQVCTKTDECPQAETCYRYHCAATGQEHAALPLSTPSPSPLPPTPISPPRVTVTPPLPDATAAELRAIRRELELLRQEQAKLTAAVEDLKKGPGKPERSATYKEPVKTP